MAFRYNIPMFEASFSQSCRPIAGWPRVRIFSHPHWHCNPFVRRRSPRKPGVSVITAPPSSPGRHSSQGSVRLTAIGLPRGGRDRCGQEIPMRAL